ncbi:MAG: peptidyl-tRNA hydrolase [Pseudomonadota bacterium]|jgi:PTH1 family peptidyl-tRNA hydrolase
MGFRLVAGLGNPGTEYARTRHNAGFWFLDALMPSGWSRESRFQAEVAQGSGASRGVWFAKPLTFMNHSGDAVGAIAQFYRIEPSEILVVHDELDLDPGQVRLKQGGGHGGHNGLRSISARLGADYWRLRVGIGHPRRLGLDQEVADFVLSRARAEEESRIDEALGRCLKAQDELLNAPDKAQRVLHTDNKD